MRKVADSTGVKIVDSPYNEAPARSGNSELLCADCGFEIKPPLGKPFSNGDGKTRCASCATDFWLKHPGATAETKTAVMRPLELIEALRETDPYIATIYTEGSCYRLHLLIKRFWPGAIPVINAAGDHVGSLIGGEVYDINGIADWSYRAMDDDDIAEAEQWSFAKYSMLQIGECPICEEPIVA